MDTAMLKELILVAVLAFSGGGSAWAAPSSAELWKMLNREVHSPSWPTRPTDDRDREQYFLNLADIFKRPSEYLANVPPSDREVRAVELALRELGKFATDESGRLFPSAAAFYEDAAGRLFKDLDDSRLKSILGESLANTGTPEGVERIISLLENGSSANFYLIRELDQLYSHAGTGAIVDEGFEKRPYHPNTTLPLEKRLRKEDWMKAHAKAKARVRKLREDGKEDTATRALAERFMARKTVGMNEIIPSGESRVPSAKLATESSRNDADPEMRAPASEQGVRDLGSAQDQGFWRLLFGIGAVLLLTLGYFLMRRT